MKDLEVLHQCFVLKFWVLRCGELVGASVMGQ